MTNPDLSAEITKINQIIHPLLGYEAWGVKLGIGSFITMEFGTPVIKRSKKIHGEWHLWIYCCGWYLENQNRSFIGSEDPREILKSEVTVLEGQRLENIVISPIALETNFRFSNGKVLHTFPLNFIDPCEYWKLFTPTRKVLILGPAKHWSFEDSSTINP